MSKIISLIVALFILYGAKAQTTDTTNSTTTAPAITNDTTVYEQFAVDSPAHFKGGNAAWSQFLIHNLQMDVATRNGAPKGTYVAMAKFIVNKRGKVENIVPLTTVGYGTEEELKRILKISGKWIPATIKGEPVNSYLTQQVTFKISTY